MFKVHPIDAGDQRQRFKNKAMVCKHLHHIIGLMGIERQRLSAYPSRSTSRFEVIISDTFSRSSWISENNSVFCGRPMVFSENSASDKADPASDLGCLHQTQREDAEIPSILVWMRQSFCSDYPLQVGQPSSMSWIKGNNYPQLDQGFCKK